MKLGKQTATRRLTNRWHEQVRLYPSMRDDIPLRLYVRRNLAAVINSPRGLESLIEYDGEV